MRSLETYLAGIATLRGATKETSGLSGAGIPGGGLFLPDELKNRNEEESFIDQKGMSQKKSLEAARF